jgi:hypothetical protein
MDLKINVGETIDFYDKEFDKYSTLKYKGLKEFNVRHYFQAGKLPWFIEQNTFDQAEYTINMFGVSKLYVNNKRLFGSLISITDEYVIFRLFDSEDLADEFVKQYKDLL